MAEMDSKYDFSGIRKARKSNFSPEEVDALVSTVGKHYHVLYGEFAKRAVNKQARHKVWMDVTKQVNRVSLERRTLQEVKNKWKKCQHLFKEQEYVDDFVLPNVWEPLPPLKDSMPLEQRLKAPPEQEPVLQSQPLSPTKLKVTRQSTKPPQPSPKPPTPEPPNEEVCLRWNSHHSNMQTSFPSLLLREQYVDATLVAEGQSLKCHRLILSSCSPYFEEVLSGISPFQHPVLFMKDIPFWVLKSLCDFMYAGEVHIFQNKLEELLAIAENLKIKGLAGKMDGGGTTEENRSPEPSKPVKEEKKEERETKEKKKSSQHSDFTAKQNSRTVRSVHPSKRSEKIGKEPLSKDGILDPLDLLEPVYEEVTKESGPPKLKEARGVPMKKGKLKKRKFSEEREESPPPLFLSRKGTRSRPNVKIPKYYHTHYERVSESTIVREPHTEPDPLLQVEEIKAEPLDLDDDVIEIEDNVIGFTDVSDLASHDEEIIGNYDSPLVNLNDKIDKEEEPTTFKKINLIAQPIIMNVHSIAEKSSTLQIIDVEQIKGSKSLDKSDDPLGDTDDCKVVDDPLNFVSQPADKGAESITITNVQSMAELEDTTEKKNELIGEEENMESTEVEIVRNEDNCDFRIEKVVSEEEAEAGTSENNVSVNDKDKQNSIEELQSLEHTEDSVTEEANDFVLETSPASVTVEKQEDTTHPAIENEKSANDEESELIEFEENSVEIGFHIAKVASEQFSVTEETKDVASEDCTSALGFQITNVVSGTIEDLEHPDVSSDDLGTFSNHLEETGSNVPDKTDNEMELGSALTDAGSILSEDAQFLAESLERLLDK